MNRSVINVTFSASSQEAAEGFATILSENVTHIGEVWTTIKEKSMDCADGSKNSYWQGLVSLTVETENLNNCLVQADTVKSGYIPNCDHIFAGIFRDTRIEVATDVDHTTPPLYEQNKYLMNKVQEQGKAIEDLEMSYSRVMRICHHLDQQLKALQTRYEEHHAFLHDFIDFKNLIRVVRETAEKVDEEILDTYPLQRVH